MKVRFERWLPVLLSSRSGRVVKQLESSRAMGVCLSFIERFYEQIVGRSGSLDRFLDGGLTGGVKPIFISKLNRGDVSCLVEVSRIVELMAKAADDGILSDVGVGLAVDSPASGGSKRESGRAVKQSGALISDSIQGGDSSGVASPAAGVLDRSGLDMLPPPMVPRRKRYGKGKTVG